MSTYDQARPRAYDLIDPDVRDRVDVDWSATVDAPSSDWKGPGHTSVTLSDGPVHAPRFAVRHDGTVARRARASIVGAVAPLRMAECELPYMAGSADVGQMFGECADLGLFGELLRDHVMVKRSMTEPAVGRRYAVVTGLDRWADEWTRQLGATHLVCTGVDDDGEPIYEPRPGMERVVGTEYVAAHSMLNVDDPDVRAEIPAHRNDTIATTVRSMMPAARFRRAMRTFAYDDGPRGARGSLLPSSRGRARMAWRTGHGRPRMMATNHLESHAPALQIRQDSEGRWYREADGLPWHDAPARQVYVSAAPTVAKRTHHDAVEVRDDDGKVTHRIAAHTTLRTVSSGRVVIGSSIPVSKRASQRARAALKRTSQLTSVHHSDEHSPSGTSTPSDHPTVTVDSMVQAWRAAADVHAARVADLEQMAPGERTSIAGVKVTRRAADGRWSIQGNDTRYRTASAAAHALR